METGAEAVRGDRQEGASYYDKTPTHGHAFHTQSWMGD